LVRLPLVSLVPKWRSLATPQSNREGTGRALFCCISFPWTVRFRDVSALHPSPAWWDLLATAALSCVAAVSSASGQIVEVPTALERWAPATTTVHLEVSRSRHQVAVYRGDAEIKTYPIAVGRPGWETPLGDFRIFQMLKDPTWKHPITGKLFPPGAPGNELGRYWIGIWTNGKIAVGFHGTPHPKTVGKSVSHGCLRMLRKDIAELFDEVSVGTPVTVMP
jgi:L,D-transpeptidase catalytic domain